MDIHFLLMPDRPVDIISIVIWQKIHDYNNISLVNYYGAVIIVMYVKTL